MVWQLKIDEPSLSQWLAPWFRACLWSLVHVRGLDAFEDLPPWAILRVGF